MIDWKKYDPSNPPKLYEVYLVYDYVQIRSAYFDKSPLSDEPIFLLNLGETVKNVVYYAECNLPEYVE